MEPRAEHSTGNASQKVFNEKLLFWVKPQLSTDPGKGYIERVGAGEHRRWQTRVSEPTDYENALANGIEKAFLAGVSSAADMASHLNSISVASINGDPWSESSLSAEMKRLGF